MYSIEETRHFRKDLKKCLKRGLPGAEIAKVMIPCSECHIRPDWLLIYHIDNEAMKIEFIRTGSHSDLFD